MTDHVFVLKYNDGSDGVAVELYASARSVAQRMCELDDDVEEEEGMLDHIVKALEHGSGLFMWHGEIMEEREIDKSEAAIWQHVYQEIINP